MARRLERALVGFTLALSALSACNWLTGSNDFRAGSGGDVVSGSSSGSSGAGTSGSTGGGTSSSGAPTTLDDGGSEQRIDPNLVATLASCGEVGFSGICVPHTEGWRAAATATLGFLGCPDGYPAEENYRVAAGGCGCDCTPSGGSCEGLITLRDGDGCTAAHGLPSLPGDGGCVVGALTVDDELSGSIAGTSPPPSCTGTPRPSFVREGTAAEVCAGATAVPSSRCAAHEGCYPRGSFIEARNCIIHDGDVGCPAKMPRRTVLGTSVSDDRACGACACSTPGCGTGGVVELYRRNDCAGTSERVEIGAACRPINPIDSASFRYRASNGCAVATPSPVSGGAATIAQPRTLCCVDGL